MKRADLKVEDVVYLSTNNDWATPKYGSGNGHAVKIVAVEPYKERRQSWRKDDRFMQVASGSGVLVEKTDFEGKPHQMIVNLGHLRGSYEETAAKVQAWCAERDQVNHVRQQAEDYLRESVRLVSAGLGTLGYPHPERIYATGDGQRAVIPVDLLIAMFEGLKDEWVFTGSK